MDEMTVYIDDALLDALEIDTTDWTDYTDCED